MSERGYCFNLAGENIGWNTYADDVATAQIHQMFMDSPGHRENIMGRAWDVIGIGAYKGPGGKKMWTVLFADKCGTTATPKPTAKPTPRPTPKPTPKSTPKPTVKPTAKPALATPPPSATPTPPPTTPPAQPDRTLDDPDPRAAAPPTGEIAANLRVMDPPEQRGLFDSIVGGATAAFFGS
jgi:hypothetical protein